MMKPQKNRIVRHIFLPILTIALLVVLRLAILDGVSQGRSSSFLGQPSTPVVIPPSCNVLPVEDFAIKYVAQLSIQVLSTDQQNSFTGAIPAGFLANGQPYATINVGKELLTSIKPGDYLQIVLAPDSASEFTALAMKPIDQQTYATCKAIASYFTAQARQISDRQVLYWENGSQRLFFDPTQFSVSVDRPIQVMAQFNENGVATVLRVYNV